MTIDELIEKLQNIDEKLKGEMPEYYPAALEYIGDFTSDLRKSLPEIIKHLEDGRQFMNTDRGKFLEKKRAIIKALKDTGYFDLDHAEMLEVDQAIDDKIIGERLKKVTINGRTRT